MSSKSSIKSVFVITGKLATSASQDAPTSRHPAAFLSVDVREITGHT